MIEYINGRIAADDWGETSESLELSAFEKDSFIQYFQTSMDMHPKLQLWITVSYECLFLLVLAILFFGFKKR